MRTFASFTSSTSEYLLAREESHEVARAFRLDRFATGHLLDEKGQGPHPNLH